MSSQGSAGGPVRSPRSTTSSHGPSALEKVLSKTRPSYLPPKNKEEDNKHLKDWEDMMRKSRAAEDKRKALVTERRRAREAAVEASIPVWEREIVPDWRAATRDPRLRGLWWNGIPSNLRGQLWEQAIGNDIALSKDSFSRCSARGRRARESGVHPLGPANVAAIEADISTTLPSLHIFRPTTGPMYEDLRDILCAFMIARSDEGISHYVPGTARAAAMLLLNLPPPRAFIALRNLLERHCLRSFFGGEAAKEEVDAYYRIFDTLLADCMPKIYFNFKQHHISPAAYLPDWIIPLFVDHLPVEACTRVWDGIVLHGDAFLFRVALALLSNIEMRLFFPDRKELLEVLRGENRAAQEVARRTGVLGPELEGAGKYAQYGVDEESVWQRIIEMDDWWKETTWARLIQRELPDL
ncbi:hypothetical protein AURDEDRAFT_51327 [Auricularia subglabra TFB-10046 SS5]|nr:hypothetical protein AURDEDRAFT_51327 [Auricularia subglabra TFB-10046 SS5]